MRAKELTFERVQNLGNYNSARIGVVMEIAEGERFADVLDAARKAVAAALAVEIAKHREESEKQRAA